MLITVVISDEIVREAQSRSLQVNEFVETLIDKGFAEVNARPALNNAIERIRALRPVGTPLALRRFAGPGMPRPRCRVDAALRALID